MVYMYRNPRDVCQSLLNHFKTLNDFSGSLQDVVNLMTNDVGITFGPYLKHILTYWNHRFDENLLVISYEEMKRDLSGHIKKISDFLEIEISDEDLANFTNHFSFGSMKANAEKMISFNASHVSSISLVSNCSRGYAGNRYSEGNFLRWGLGRMDGLFQGVKISPLPRDIFTP